MAIGTEMLLGRVLDALNVGVVATDENNNITVFNRRAGEMLGQDPGSRIGTSILQCHPAESESAVLKMISDMKNGVTGKYGGWLSYQGKTLYEYISPMWDEGQKFSGMLLVIHDAGEKAELLKRLGEWEEPHVSGVDDRAPRPARP
ncbi:MAG: PAS domain-containing protein [Chloroflexi bacterium]|nr:PAS domain-containing protein [Chloroflexota bacterium]